MEDEVDARNTDRRGIAGRRLLTLDEAADVLAVSRTTLKGLVYSQRLPAMKVGRQWRFDPALLEAWVVERSNFVRA